jgi:hypothetical protein
MKTNFAWLQKSSKNFGTVYEPIAEVELQKKDGKTWQRFVFKIDSGAVITLMNAGDCELLGYKLEDGQRVTLGAANGAPVSAYVHKMDMRVGMDEVQDVRVAFSEKPIQPLLLGRLEVFHFFDIDLRGRLGQSVFYR